MPLIAQHIKLKENSWIAAMAARKMKAGKMALVLGSTIHLYNVTANDFRGSPAWVRHELKHVEQYKRLGLWKFLVLYTWYSIKFGYYNNPLEIEARQAETLTPNLKPQTSNFKP